MAKWHYRWVIFAVTFISYASTHACRQSFASAKDLMNDTWGFTKHFDGLMDGVFLVAYSFGLFCSGVLGDKFDTARFHALGLIMTSFIYFIFGSSIPFLGISYQDYQPYYIVLWIINGFVQSIGWPTGVKLIGNWFTYSNPHQRRSWFIFRGYDSIGLIFGIWAAHQFLGNIIGIGWVSLVEHYDWKIQLAFYLPAAQAFIVGLLVLIFVRTYPVQHISQQQSMLNAAADNTSILTEKSTNIGNINSTHSTSKPLLQDYDNRTNDELEMKTDSDDVDVPAAPNTYDAHMQQYTAAHQKAEYEYGVESDSDESVPSIEYRISFKKALRVKNVLRYGIFFACLKGVNYTINFWFGYFGSTWDHESSEESGNFLIMFNVGSIVGGWCCGYLTDRYKILSKHGRSPIILLFLILSIPSVFALYFDLKDYAILYGLLCFTAGFTVGGPTNLISSVMATDIGNQQEMEGLPASFSTVSGIIDGLGSIGAAISDYVATWLSDVNHALVYAVLAGELLVGCLFIIPLVIKDSKGILNSNQKHKNSQIVDT